MNCTNKENCLFCRIIKGDVPSDKVMETEHIFAFYDINPQAPVHILVIPKVHIETVYDLSSYELPYMSLLTAAANSIADKLMFRHNGYRLIVNCGEDGGQEVYHLHLHLIAGRRMNWPAG